MRRGILIVAGLCASMAPAIASAQDVIVMRRSIAAGTIQEYSFREGDWTRGAPSCSAHAIETSTPQCTDKSGHVVAADRCKGVATPVTREYDDDRTCSWNWSTADAECRADATRNLTVTCRRSDGSLADDARCTGPKPATTRSDPACQTYEWNVGDFTPWSSTCSTAAQPSTRSRLVYCVGSADRQPAPNGDASCSEPKPETSETGVVTTSCGILRNMGFDEGTTAWNPSVANPAHFVAEPTGGIDGGPAVRIVAPYNALNFVEQEASGPTPAGKMYEVAVWVRINDPKVIVYLEVYGVAANGSNKYNAASLTGEGRVGQWTRLSAGLFGSTAAKKLKVALNAFANPYMQVGSGGSATFDRLEIIEQ